MAGQTDKDKGLAQIAARLNRLFERRHPEDRGPYSIGEVSTGTGISDTLIRGMRRGDKTNPTIDTLMRLAAFFDVPPTFWVSEDPEKEIAGRDLQRAMEDAGVHSVALRTKGLDARGMRFVIESIDMARSSQGLPPAENPDEPTN
ncbi:transcriptional regulator with XRE-family HTH domain [Streptacidiphilus sp. MAP12-33]|uniref:helix-turn-helix domain-containing protein n=1 Tax=Streptacidiphilus sp. MAP12-33 TaxID=3156266 RepID=UPI003515CD00